VHPLVVSRRCGWGWCGTSEVVGIGLRDARNTCKRDNSGVQVEFVTWLRDEKTVFRVVEYFEDGVERAWSQSQLESLAESYLRHLPQQAQTIHPGTRGEKKVAHQNKRNVCP